MAEDYSAAFRRLSEELQTAAGPRALDLTAQMIELAEAHNDSAVAEDATVYRMRLANDLGDFTVEFAMFEQLVRWFESGRTNLKARVLWHFKWIAEHLHEYPELTREQIDAFFDRMEAFFTAHEVGLKPVYGLRMAEAAAAGHEVEFDAWRSKWDAAPEDKTDDCPACQTHMLVESLIAVGRTDEAVEAADPLLKGEQFCDEVPATTFSRLLLPVLRTPHARMAFAYHKFSLRYLRKHVKMLRYLADHILFLCVLRQPEQADRIAMMTMARMDVSTNGLARFRCAAALYVWATARRAGGCESIRVPRRLSWAADGTTTTDALIARFRQEAQDLAKRFDKRNGTSLFSKRLEAAEKMAEFVSMALPSDDSSDEPPLRR